MALRSTDDTANGSRRRTARPSPPSTSTARWPTGAACSPSWSACAACVAGAARRRCASPPPSLRAAITGGTAADEVKEKLFTRLLGGLAVTEVDRRSAVFAHRHLQRHLRDDARRRLEWHRGQGHYTVIVSASPECYVSPAGEELGVDGVVATRLAVGGGGLLTGGYEGKNCRGRREVRPAGRPPPLPRAALEHRRRAAGAVGLRQQPR